MYLYFSTGQYKNVIKNVKDRANEALMPIPTMTFKGTVKIHGTNSSLFNNLKDDIITVQSKNNIITPEEDNYGFAQKVSENHLLYLQIFKEINKDFSSTHKGFDAVIYGEFCGEKIQVKENLGVSKLNKKYIIFSIKLIKETNEYWLSEDEVCKVINNVGIQSLNQAEIYNIYQFPTWTLDIDMNNPKLSQNELIKITSAVEDECPVSKYFGETGIGEGVVWKCVSIHPGIKTDDLVFKVKGQEHSVSNVKTIAEVDIEQVNSINEFVQMVLTENRLNQAVEYLHEQHLDVDTKNMGVFLKWITADCIKEEGETLKKSNLELKDVMPSISNQSKQWFLRKCGSDKKNKM